MTYAGMECFLAICRHKTLSAAAQALYITQPSLSARLKTLERELGGVLFYRKKGCREMALTPAGKALYDLALEYEALTEKIQQVCRSHRSSLRISSLNSLGTYLLPAVYERFVQQHPHIALEIQDMELPEASRSIRSGETDIAFTAGKSADALLEQTPVFTEPMVLICGMDARYAQPVEVQQLSVRDEVYIEWSSAFARWHQQTFGANQPHIRISIMAQLRQFMTAGHAWAFVPVSVAEGLEREGHIRRLEAAFALPCREVCVLTAANSENRDPAVDAFLQCLKDYLNEHPDIKPLM